MERDQLQHLADFLCHAFTDIGLMHDYQQLAELRAGSLWMDIRFGHTFFNGKPLPTLLAPQRLRGELDMKLGGDAATVLEEATLKVHFDTERYEQQRDLSVQWAKPTGHFVSCKVQCRSRVGTSRETATGLYTETLEWPYPFPARGPRGPVNSYSPSPE